MQTVALDLETLHQLSQELTEDFKEQMKVAVADCRRRPAYAKPRIVKVEIRITPHPDDAEDISIQPVTTLKTPARQLDPIRAQRSRTDQLQFDY